MSKTYRHSKIIAFERGDRVCCTYYNTEGVIEAIYGDPNDPDNPAADIIKIRPHNQKNKDDYVYTHVRIKSTNRPAPFYLQMLCKREDIHDPKPEVTEKQKCVRVINLLTEEEYTFMPDYDPVIAVCYCFYTNNQQSSWFFEKLYDGTENWREHVAFGKHSVAKGDWCALLRDKHQ